MPAHDHWGGSATAYPVIKRSIDFIVAVVLLCILAFPMTLVALAIFLTDFGNPIFSQTRVGYGCHHFKFFKFRSMIVGADQRGGFVTDSGDSRITFVGGFLRRTSLDELPQLLNVLRGDMSLIGPRPDVPAQEALYTKEQWAARHRVRPGITGLAQATERSLLTPDRRTALDLVYAENLSLPLDLRILAMTVGQLLKGGST